MEERLCSNDACNRLRPVQGGAYKWVADRLNPVSRRFSFPMFKGGLPITVCLLGADGPNLVALYTFAPSDSHPKILHQVVVEIKIERASRWGRPGSHGILQTSNQEVSVSGVSA